MRSILSAFTIILSLVLMGSCGVIHSGYNSALSSGNYMMEGGVQVYIEEAEDVFHLYTFDEREKAVPEASLGAKAPQDPGRYRLSRHSFDLDLVTIPFKYRFSGAGLPPQLNTNINAAVFTGLRRDFHTISYSRDRLGLYHRKVSNVGLSAGIFNGIGNTILNPSTTNNALSVEYDGIVWMYGVNFVLGWNKMTIGLALGRDHLLDDNDKVWIYNNKTWLGVTLGLNLN